MLFIRSHESNSHTIELDSELLTVNKLLTLKDQEAQIGHHILISSFEKVIWNCICSNTRLLLDQHKQHPALILP